MKTLILFGILFCMIASPGLAALTDADLDKIRLIVKEEVKEEIRSSETRMKIYIDTKIDSVNIRIDSVEKRMDGFEKQMTFLLNIIYGLIALIIVAIGIPQVIIGWRSKRDRSLENRIEMLTEEIEALKRRQIIKP